MASIPDKGPPRSPRLLRPGLLVWLTALAAWLAFAPLRLRQGAIRFQLEPAFDDELVGHLLLLLPLAVALAATADRSTRSLVRVLLLVVLAGGLLELGQVFIDDRALSLFDFAFGVIGAIPAIIVTRLALRTALRRDTILRALLAALVAAAFVSVGLSARAHNVDLRLADWNPKHVVVVADEFDAADRKYDGVVSGAQICAGRGTEQLCVTGGANAESRRRIVRLAEESQYVELFADIVSNSDDQNGPNRIVTFSWGPYGRNISLMQHRRSLILRVRTPRTGPNGTLSQFILPRVIDVGVPTRVTASFDSGRIAIGATPEATNGVVGRYSAPFHATLLARGRRAVQAPYVLRGRGLTAATLVMFAGLGLAAVTFSRRSGRWLLLTAGPLALLLLWLLSTTWWAAPPPRLFEHVATLVATTLGVLLGLWDRPEA